MQKFKLKGSSIFESALFLRQQLPSFPPVTPTNKIGHTGWIASYCSNYMQWLYISFHHSLALCQFFSALCFSPLHFSPLTFFFVSPHTSFHFHTNLSTYHKLMCGPVFLWAQGLRLYFRGGAFMGFLWLGT